MTHNQLIESLRGRQSILKALKDNLQWISRSFAVNQNQGSSAYMTWYGKWSEPYPETTGYLISTLLDAAELLQKDEYTQLAHAQLSYFKSIQRRQAFVSDMRGQKLYVFDNAQIVLGLIALYEHHPSDEILTMISGLSIWLTECLSDTEAGVFCRNNYIKGYNPSYYSRIAWPMLKAAQLCGLSSVEHAAQTVIEKVLSEQRDNGSFKNWGLTPGADGLLHTIAYSYRGLWEYADLADNEEIKQLVIKSVTNLRMDILKTGRVGAYYDQKWNANRSFQCIVGNIQLAILFDILYQSDDNNSEWKSAISILMKPIINRKKQLISKSALPGSLPIWGPYQRGRYPNWTQKFYCDLLIRLLK